MERGGGEGQPSQSASRRTVSPTVREDAVVRRGGEGLRGEEGGGAGQWGRPGWREEDAVRQAGGGRRSHHRLVIEGAVDVRESLVSVVAPRAGEPPQVDRQCVVWAGIAGVEAV